MDVLYVRRHGLVSVLFGRIKDVYGRDFASSLTRSIEA